MEPARINDAVRTAGDFDVVWAGSVGADANLMKGDIMPRALLVLTPGDLVVTKRDGTNETLPNAGQAMLFPVQVRALVAVGSDAYDIVVLY